VASQEGLSSMELDMAFILLELKQQIYTGDKKKKVKVKLSL
jgi:hypothetical protein